MLRTKLLSLVYLFIPLMVIFFFSCEEEEEKIPPLVITMEATDVSSFGGADGTIEISHTGGKPPYYYFWNTGDTTKNLRDLKVGTYTIQVTYGHIGVASKTVEIKQPQPAPLNITFDITDVSSYSYKDGKAVAEVSGGTPPYSYYWEASGDTNQFIRRVKAGDYKLTVTDNSSPEPIVTSATATVNQPEFVCGEDSIMDIDGYKYATVNINGRCWFSENLRTIHRPDSPDSVLIPIDGRFCKGAFCTSSEGAHYTWTAAMNDAESVDSLEQVQGICPEGFHIPTKYEWDQLIQYLSVDGNGGEGMFPQPKLLSKESSSGFDALYTGNWGFGVYDNTEIAPFWTATQTEKDESKVWFIMVYDFPIVAINNAAKTFGFNVRCLQN